MSLYLHPLTLSSAGREPGGEKEQKQANARWKIEFLQMWPMKAGTGLPFPGCFTSSERLWEFWPSPTLSQARCLFSRVLEHMAPESREKCLVSHEKKPLKILTKLNNSTRLFSFFSPSSTSLFVHLSPLKSFLHRPPGQIPDTTEVGMPLLFKSLLCTLKGEHSEGPKCPPEREKLEKWVKIKQKRKSHPHKKHISFSLVFFFFFSTSRTLMRLNPTKENQGYEIFLLCWRGFRYIKTNYCLFYAPVGWEIPLKLGWELMPVGKSFLCEKKRAGSIQWRAPSTHSLSNPRDGDSRTSLGRLSQCLTTLKVKNFFLKSNLNQPQGCFSLSHQYLGEHRQGWESARGNRFHS